MAFRQAIGRSGRFSQCSLGLVRNRSQSECGKLSCFPVWNYLGDSIPGLSLC